MGWIANLLSTPVTVGFLAGISVHILVSQLPSVLGLPPPKGPMLDRIVELAQHAGAPIFTPAIGLGVLAIVAGAEAVSAKIPGALVGLVAATIAVVCAGLESKGVAVVGAVPATLPTPSLPDLYPGKWAKLVPLALLIAIVVMVQTAATTRAFPSDPDKPADVDRDFLGAGAGSVLAGLFGAFPVDASPPRTGIVAETGGRTQLSGLFAAAIVLALLAFGAALLRHVPSGARRRAAVRGAAHHPHQADRDGVPRVVRRIPADRRHRRRDHRAADRTGRRRRHRTVAAARHLEHDARAAGAVRACAGHHDLVAGQSAHGGRANPGVAVVGLQAPLSFLNA